jgi:hypothetical protein
LTRSGSQQPFAHLLPSADPPELINRIACLTPSPSGTAEAPDASANAAPAAVAHGASGPDSPGTAAAHVGIRPEHAAAVAQVLRAQQACRNAGTLLTIKYTTIFEYLTVRERLSRQVNGG